MTTTTQSVNIEKSFIYQTLTKIGENDENPNYSSIKKLQKKLVSNAVSIQSTLGDGINGPLFLVLSDTEYTVATISTTHPVGVTTPIAPIIHVQLLSLAQRSITVPTIKVCYEVTDEVRNYEATKSKCFLYHNTSKASVKKIIVPVP